MSFLCSLGLLLFLVALSTLGYLKKVLFFIIHDSVEGASELEVNTFNGLRLP